MIRQGDILFIPASNPPTQYVNKNKDEKGVIALGEATGHHHRIATEDLGRAELFKPWNGQVNGSVLKVSAEGGISIVHEEHHTVTLPQGDYVIHQAREYDYFNRLSVPVRD